MGAAAWPFAAWAYENDAGFDILYWYRTESENRKAQPVMEESLSTFARTSALFMRGQQVSDGGEAARDRDSRLL